MRADKEVTALPELNLISYEDINTKSDGSYTYCVVKIGRILLLVFSERVYRLFTRL